MQKVGKTFDHVKYAYLDAWTVQKIMTKKSELSGLLFFFFFNFILGIESYH